MTVHEHRADRSAERPSAPVVGHLWWHVYGGQMALGTAVDEDGSPSRAYKLDTYCESTLHPDDVPERFGGETPTEYLGSFDHEPTDGELDALKPEPYREGPTAQFDDPKARG